MNYQAIFQRYELKYLLTADQKARVLQTMAPYMSPDSYGRTTIRNIYFDTPDHLLIRRSIEKPIYKEKLRIRSYRKAAPTSHVFVELKKKYKGIVYKRRLSLSHADALRWLSGDPRCAPEGQISREINYVLELYPRLSPVVFLTYEREAYYSLDGTGFRVTFDDNILCRRENISLEAEPGGTPLLSSNMVLMEIKSAGSLPLWMTRLLSREKLYKTSFSKYGAAYRTLIYPHLKGGFTHA